MRYTLIEYAPDFVAVFKSDLGFPLAYITDELADARWWVLMHGQLESEMLHDARQGASASEAYLREVRKTFLVRARQLGIEVRLR